MSLVSTLTPRPTGRGIGATVAKATDKADKAAADKVAKADKAVMSHQLQLDPTALPLEAELRSLGETNRVSEAPGSSAGRQGGEECIRKGRVSLRI